jgi:hypothetical protein
MLYSLPCQSAQAPLAADASAAGIAGGRRPRLLRAGGASAPLAPAAAAARAGPVAAATAHGQNCLQLRGELRRARARGAHPRGAAQHALNKPCIARRCWGAALLAWRHQGRRGAQWRAAAGAVLAAAAPRPPRRACNGLASGRDVRHGIERTAWAALAAARPPSSRRLEHARPSPILRRHSSRSRAAAACARPAPHTTAPAPALHRPWTSTSDLVKPCAAWRSPQACLPDGRAEPRPDGGRRAARLCIAHGARRGAARHSGHAPVPSGLVTGARQAGLCGRRGVPPVRAGWRARGAVLGRARPAPLAAARRASPVARVSAAPRSSGGGPARERAAPRGERLQCHCSSFISPPKFCSHVQFVGR